MGIFFSKNENKPTKILRSTTKNTRSTARNTRSTARNTRSTARNTGSTGNTSCVRNIQDMHILQNYEKNLKIKESTDKIDKKYDIYNTLHIDKKNVICGTTSLNLTCDEGIILKFIIEKYGNIVIKNKILVKHELEKIKLHIDNMCINYINNIYKTYINNTNRDNITKFIKKYFPQISLEIKLQTDKKTDNNTQNIVINIEKIKKILNIIKLKLIDLIRVNNQFNINLFITSIQEIDLCDLANIIYNIPFDEFKEFIITYINSELNTVSIPTFIKWYIKKFTVNFFEIITKLHKENNNIKRETLVSLCVYFGKIVLDNIIIEGNNINFINLSYYNIKDIIKTDEEILIFKKFIVDVIDLMPLLIFPQKILIKSMINRYINKFITDKSLLKNNIIKHKKYICVLHFINKTVEDIIKKMESKIMINNICVNNKNVNKQNNEKKETNNLTKCSNYLSKIKYEIRFNITDIKNCFNAFS